MMKICSSTWSSISCGTWIGLSYTVITIPYIAEEMAVATDKTRYKDVKFAFRRKNWLYWTAVLLKQVCPENNISVAWLQIRFLLNIRQQITGLSFENWMNCRRWWKHWLTRTPSNEMQWSCILRFKMLRVRRMCCVGPWCHLCQDAKRNKKWGCCMWQPHFLLYLIPEFDRRNIIYFVFLLYCQSR